MLCMSTFTHVCKHNWRVYSRISCMEDYNIAPHVVCNHSLNVVSNHSSTVQCPSDVTLTRRVLANFKVSIAVASSTLQCNKFIAAHIAIILQQHAAGMVLHFFCGLVLCWKPGCSGWMGGSQGTVMDKLCLAPKHL